MPTLAELAQMSDNAYVGYPQLQRQANKMRLAQMGRIPENLPDPRTYGFVKGLTGTSPDELGMSVLSPNTAPAKDAAYYGYQLSNFGQMSPAMMPATKAALRTAGNAVNDAMVYGTGPLARITPQPMRMIGEDSINLPQKGSKLVQIPIDMIEHGESIMPGGKLTWPGAKEKIQEYASRKTPLPPIDVMSNESGIPWMVADGSHRLEAAKLKGQKTISAYVSPYDKEGLEFIKKHKLTASKLND